MNQPVKLKPVSFFMSFIFPILSASLISAGVWIGFGEDFFKLVMSGLMLLPAWYNFLILMRSKSLWYAASMLFYIFTPLTFLSTMFFENETITLFFAIPASIFCMLLFYMLFTKKLKIWNREILELAAKPVQENADGFTSRPYPAGEAQYSREDINNLAEFMIKNLICFPYFSEDRILFVISGYRVLHFLQLRKDFHEDTYVSFSNDGEVTVNIAKKDYQQYKEELTFNQLCQSLGDLFKEFLERNKSGNGSQIKERMNALNFLP